MASIGSEQQILTNSTAVDPVQRPGTRESSVERKVAKERDEKLKLARERQNEERQRKIEELKAQAEAAQRYREQKEEERRRRIEEIRNRDSEKRHQVEERKRAIMEAEKERREYILRKNQERESRLETKKREKNSIYAFGSSTPRLLEPADFGTVSPSTFWGPRRSTSISNVAGATLSRRSSERELVNSGAKKRATSATGADRHDEDNVDTPQIMFRSVARRKTDLMPTIPSPRDGHHYGSRTSLSTTPKTPGRAYSMNRLDQLAQPIRRNGEHIRAILERERRERMEMSDETESLGGGGRSGFGTRGKKQSSGTRGSNIASISRSMTHLSGSGGRAKYTLAGGISTNFRPLDNGIRDSCSLSGNVTPGGSISTSRPGSAMSTSTTLSTSGYVVRRPISSSARKPRPASIAGTGVSLDDINKLKRENKPPVKSSSNLASAQTTSKRTSNIMSTSMIVTSSSSRLSSAEKRTPTKRVLPSPKSTTPKPVSKTSSSDRINKLVNQQKDEPFPTTSTAVEADTTQQEREKASAAAAVSAAQSKDEKNAMNSMKTDEAVCVAAGQNQIPPSERKVEETEVATTAAIEAATIVKPVVEVVTAPTAEMIDQGDEKKLSALDKEKYKDTSVNGSNGKGSRDSSEMRELLLPAPTEGNDIMTASMIARNKITTEEEAKAALAERRRAAREEAERQAELERQRIEAEKFAELKRQEMEVERQRLFEEEAMRLAEEQRDAEEERLRLAIEEAKQREEEERRKREEETRQRLEREEAEKKAKEEAEKQRLEVAERLKREEKEREERRKRVEAIMSRTRKGGAAATPNSIPVKENNEPPKATSNDAQQQQQQFGTNSSSDNNSTSGSTTTATTPTLTPTNQTPTGLVPVCDQINSQAVYEQSVIDKENALLNSFSNIIIDENAKNLQQQQQQTRIFEVTNGKTRTDFPNSDEFLQNSTTTTAVANGNGHIENINNKNDINLLQDVVPATNQLIDLSIESQDINNDVNFNNNNSLLTTTTTTLVTTADSHENKDISLL